MVLPNAKNPNALHRSINGYWLGGKNEFGLKGDDKRNPACNADNVGWIFCEEVPSAIRECGRRVPLDTGWDVHPLLLSAHMLHRMLNIILGRQSSITQLVPWNCIGYIIRARDEQCGVEQVLEGTPSGSAVIMIPLVVGLSLMALPDLFDMSETITEFVVIGCLCDLAWYLHRPPHWLPHRPQHSM